MKPNHEKTPPEDFCSCDSGTCGPAPQGKEFIPMVWGYDETDRPWHDDLNDEVEAKYPIILGFNEPNHADQSDIAPEEAAAAWIELQTKYPDRVGYRIQDATKTLKCKFVLRFWSALPLLEATQIGLIPFLMLARPWAAELITWQPMTMTAM